MIVEIFTAAAMWFTDTATAAPAKPMSCQVAEGVVLRDCITSKLRAANISPEPDWDPNWTSSITPISEVSQPKKTHKISPKSLDKRP